VVAELEMLLELLVLMEQLTLGAVEAAVLGSGGSGGGGTGGSGIVIVKELNKASGSWPLRAQFSSRNRERGLHQNFQLVLII
jgi:hypothetical protein